MTRGFFHKQWPVVGSIRLSTVAHTSPEESGARTVINREVSITESAMPAAAEDAQFLKDQVQRLSIELARAQGRPASDNASEEVEPWMVNAERSRRCCRRTTRGSQSSSGERPRSERRRRI